MAARLNGMMAGLGFLQAKGPEEEAGSELTSFANPCHRVYAAFVSQTLP